MHATKNQFWDDAIPIAATIALEPALGIIAICSSSFIYIFKKGFWWIWNRCGVTSEQPASGSSQYKIDLVIQGNMDVQREMTSIYTIIEARFFYET